MKLLIDIKPGQTEALVSLLHELECCYGIMWGNSPSPRASIIDYAHAIGYNSFIDLTSRQYELHYASNLRLGNIPFIKVKI